MADIGLVLSGGAARGIAHPGLVQRLEELGIKPKIISGVSLRFLGDLIIVGLRINGDFFDYYRTQKASLLKPIEALRYE